VPITTSQFGKNTVMSIDQFGARVSFSPFGKTVVSSVDPLVIQLAGA